MPVYEYRCQDCHKVSSVLTFSWTSSKPKCKHCSGANLTKLISSFSVHRSGAPVWTLTPPGDQWTTLMAMITAWMDSPESNAWVAGARTLHLQ